MSQAKSQRRRGQNLAAGGRELDRQWKSIYLGAYGCDDFGVAFIQDKTWMYCLSALDKQSDRGVPTRFFHGQRDAGRQERHRRNGKLVLGAEMEGCPTRDQHLEIGTGCDEIAQRRRNVDNLFEIVQYEQMRAAAESAGEEQLQWNVVARPETKRLSDRRQDEVGICDGSK